MTAAEVAEYLGVSITDVNKLVVEGRLQLPIELGPQDHLWRRSYIEGFSIRLCMSGRCYADLTENASCRASIFGALD